MIKHCAICGAEYKAFPSDRRTTCGQPNCVLERKRRSHVGKRNVWSVDSRQKLSRQGKTANLQKGTPAALQSPVSGPFESNHQALTWVLQSPDGITYKFRNLRLWLRQHVEMLDGTPEQAHAGIMQIKRSMQGKTKRPVSQWKGWRLLIRKKQI